MIKAILRICADVTDKLIFKSMQQNANEYRQKAGDRPEKINSDTDRKATRETRPL